MKIKVSVSLDEQIISIIDRITTDPKYRNRSHFIENAIHKELNFIKKSKEGNFFQKG